MKKEKIIVEEVEEIGINMLNNRQIRMLELLDKQVLNCRKCELKINGCLKPFWTTDSKYCIITESPTSLDIGNQIPFSGQSGNIATNELDNVGLKAKDFLIIHSVQCKSNFKPTESQMLFCQDHVRKYIKVMNPEKILCLGNHGKYLFTGRMGGILSQRGKFNEYSLEGSNIKYPALFTVHPAYCLYNQEGLDILRQDIKLFKETDFYKSNFLFTEEEFRIY